MTRVKPAGTRDERGRLLPGAPSLNPRGRPRTGLALAEAIRRKIDPEQITDMLLRFANDEDVALDKRLLGLLPWVQLGYLRPPSTSAVRVETAPGAPTLDVAAMPLEVQRELLVAIRRARAALPGDYSGDSSEETGK